MTPIVSIVGRSGSGKTTLIEALVSKLTTRGYRVATIKHDVHGFEIDHEGKDSWRHKQAGAAVVVLSSPRQIALVMDVEREWDPGEMGMFWTGGVDLVLTEGYKRASFPKIEVNLTRESEPWLCAGDSSLEAVVSNWKPARALAVPFFLGSEVDRLTDWMERRFLGVKSFSGCEVRVGEDQIALSLEEAAALENAVKSWLARLTGKRVPEIVEIRLGGKGGHTVRADSSRMGPVGRTR